MANTLSSSLVLDTIAKSAKKVLPQRLAAYSGFTTDFSDETMFVNAGQSLQVSLATAAATAQSSPTNWESGDTTIANRPITVTPYSISWHLTPAQTNNSFRMEQLVGINVDAFANKLASVINALFDGTHWTNFIEAQSTFSVTNLKTMRAGIARSPQRNILLDSTYYANFLPASLSTEIGPRAGLAGFENFYETSYLTGAGTNVMGFAGGSQCIGIYSCLPQYSDRVRESIESQVVSVPVGDKTFSVLASTWTSLATRTDWASLDVILGAGRLDNTKGYLIKSGGGA